MESSGQSTSDSSTHTTIRIESESIPPTEPQTNRERPARNFLSFLNETGMDTSDMNLHSPFLYTNNRRWQEVFPSLRSLITRPGNFRYSRLNTLDTLQAETGHATFRNAVLRNNQFNEVDNEANGNTNRTPASVINVDDSTTPSSSTNNNNSGNNQPLPIFNDSPRDNTPPRRHQATTTASDDLDDVNVVSDIVVSSLRDTLRYLPFVWILLLKLMHDNILGILDLVLLHGVMYTVNKTLRIQIAKFSQKSYKILIREFALIVIVIVCRFSMSASSPDPFGWLITPSAKSVPVIINTASSDMNREQAIEPTISYLNQFTKSPSIEITPEIVPVDHNVKNESAPISLGTLLYFVAINDLMLKLITILVKISITLLPTKIMKHKPRARMFVLIENTSQFYRAVAPVRYWLTYLFESYSGFEVIFGVFFTSLYLVVKLFEFMERGKSLQRAVVNFIRNMDYERKPTKEELEASGTICPICHDNYNTPVILECNHIFCDDCVSTWFKREQTCPMCRAKLSEDPTWQDGSTTFFYQLF